MPFLRSLKLAGLLSFPPHAEPLELAPLNVLEMNNADNEIDSLIILLVDSEEAIAAETGDEAIAAAERMRHLVERDGWVFNSIR